MMEDLAIALRQPNPNICVRPVASGDDVELHQKCWPDRPIVAIQQLLARVQQYRQQGRGLGLVVLDKDSKLIGYGQLITWVRTGEISDLVIADDCRGQGLGTAIIQHLTQEAVRLKMPQLEIGAALSNPRALALYRRLGFRDSHEILLNLGNGREPVIYLCLEL